jgi:hypothetical protein
MYFLGRRSANLNSMAIGQKQPVFRKSISSLRFFPYRGYNFLGNLSTRARKFREQKVCILE